jgi:predicted HTH domain antitoxin
MKSYVASTRLGPDQSKALDDLAKLEGLDRATLLRQLLSLGLETYRQNAAVAAYANEKVSLGRAAELAGVSQWEMLGLLEKRHVHASYDAGEFQKDMNPRA